MTTQETTNEEVTLYTYSSPLSPEQIKLALANYAPIDDSAVETVKAKIADHNKSVNDQIKEVMASVDVVDTDSFLRAGEQVKELKKTLYSVPSDEEIRLELGESFVNRIMESMQLGMAVLKRRGGGEETFANKWAVSTAYKGFTIRLINFRKLTVEQKSKYGLKHAGEWLVLSPRLKGHKIVAVSNVGELLKEVRTFINGEEYTSPVSKAEWDSVIELPQSEVEKL